MIRKVISIFLVLLLSFNLAGIFLIFKIQQNQIRHDIKMQLKQGVSDDKLHKISFASSQVHQIEWVRKNKEFRHKGQMYDVVRKETEGNYVHFYCINDTEETALFANLDQMVKSQTGEDSEHPSGNHAKKILKLLSVQYLANSEKFHTAIFPAKNLLYSGYNNNYSFLLSKRDVIPPEFI